MAACLIAEAFFSGSEIGVVSAESVKLRHDAAKGSRGARLALKMLERPEWLLSTTLIGTNIAVVTNTTMATALMIHLFGEQYSWLAILLVAPLIWVFGEIVPKSIFQQRANTVTPKAVFLLRFASYVFYPILAVFSLVTRLLTRLVGNPAQNPFTLREEIITMVQMPASDGEIQSEEKNMIRRMFGFTETTVRQVMVPLIDVAAIERGDTVAQAVQTARESSHVRLPVFDERVDKIVGILHVLELLCEPPQASVAGYMRPVRYVPETKSVKDLLLEMRNEGDAIVVVVDEFGGAAGILSIEDIMEEIVEDIEDEYDADQAPVQWIRKLGERDYLVSARVELDTLRERLALGLPESTHTTLAGMLLERLHEVPLQGSVVQLDKLTFVIQRCSSQAIQEVRIRW